FVYSVYICMYLFVFFFFQAEDGIRDWSVTGVQTCALPISVAPLAGAAAHVVLLVADVTHAKQLERQMLLTERLTTAGRLAAGVRSEERRVGKECRARGEPDA